MKNRITLILLLTTLIACRRTETHICSTPQIILQQSGYDHTEWDTIITRVINVEFQEIESADTFIATDVTNELLITPDINRKLAFQVYLPSVNKTHNIGNIDIGLRTAEVQKGQEVECYHNVSFNVDNQRIVSENAASGTVYATLFR